MQLLGGDVTLPIFEQEPRQSQTLACWPEIHRPQALEHVRWVRHHIHITNIGRVMAEINTYVAAGGCRSVNALSPHPGPDLRTATSAIWNVTYRSWLTLSGVSVTGHQRGDRPVRFLIRQSPAGLLVARGVSSGSKHLVAATKTADDRAPARKSGGCRFGGLAGERRHNM